MMTVILDELRERNQKAKVEKRERYKVARARRPQLGSWYTIAEEAVKFQENSSVRWESQPIKDVDHRRSKFIDNTEEYKASQAYMAGWGDGRHWELPPPITSYHAMYIGYRFKFNGTWETAGAYDEGGPESYFAQSETVEVWMFVTHENRNPIAVFPFEIESEEVD